MKRHIKLFENFTEEKKNMKAYLVFSEEGEVNAEGMFATRAEAEEQRENLIYFYHDRYGSDMDDLEEAFTIEEVDLEDHAKVMDTYEYILTTDIDNHRKNKYGIPVRDILLDFINIGAPIEDIYLLVEEERMTFDELFERLEEILGKDLDMLPNVPFKDKLLRMKKGKSAFGM